jgi:arylsulfatase A-like enzyme
MANRVWFLAIMRVVVKVVACLACFGLLSYHACFSQGARPNILWITSEDNGIELGCYGDNFATSPNIDSLAAQGIRFENCWSNAPVCAPARTTIISGMYATSLGASNMRSRAKRTEGTLLLPELLRASGYYCSNNSKEDYNFVASSQPWNDSSNKAHWRNRPADAPFFSVFNFTTSHESQIRKRPHTPRHDANKVPLPPYHPDLPEIRKDWAQYYDKIEEMDAQVGTVIQQLREDNLIESTIIFYFGDHGSGMPRSKRWLYQSGLHVPMIVVIPEAFQHLRPTTYSPGGVDQRLISFVDLASTVVKLAGAPIPKYFQGKPFLGAGELSTNKSLFGFRDRMDERIDMSRAIRNERFLYIRNFMPYRPQGTFLNYMFQTPTTVAWRQAFRNGHLPAHQASFWQPKSVEELYDLQADKYQIHNIANDPSFDPVKNELRIQLKETMLATRDLGIIPESIVKSDMVNPEWNWNEMIDAAFYDRDVLPDQHALEQNNPVVRYWLAQHLRASVTSDQKSHIAEKMNLIRTLQNDPEISVQIVASDALIVAGDNTQKEQAISQLKRIANIQHSGLLNAVAALNVLANSEVEFDDVDSLPSQDARFEPVYFDYIERLKDYINHKEH